MDLDLTRIFVKVAQHRSFTRAGELLKLPKSTVSKAVSRLERETGTKLLLRTTRSLTLTAAGRAFFEACLAPLAQLEDAQKSLQGQDSILAGTIRLTAPEDLGSFVIAPAVAELSRRHPDLRFELIYTDEVIDLVQEGFDLAVRIGRAGDSTYKLRRAGEVVLVAVASPRYVKGNARIREPADLAAHPCLSLSGRAAIQRWTLRSEHGTAQEPISARASSNQMSSLLRMALHDGGVALVPAFLAHPHLKAGELVRVLPGWATPGLPVSLLSPLAPSSSARLKITADAVHAAVSSALEAHP